MNAIQMAVLQYRNTRIPSRYYLQPNAFFGRPVKDFIRIILGCYKLHPTWQDILQDREQGLRYRHMGMAERLLEHTRHLPPLKVGDHVRIQNQVGHYNRKWDKTRVIVEVRQFVCGTRGWI